MVQPRAIIYLLAKRGDAWMIYAYHAVLAAINVWSLVKLYGYIDDDQDGENIIFLLGFISILIHIVILCYIWEVLSKFNKLNLTPKKFRKSNIVVDQNKYTVNLREYNNYQNGFSYGYLLADEIKKMLLLYAFGDKRTFKKVKISNKHKEMLRGIVAGCLHRGIRISYYSLLSLQYMFERTSVKIARAIKTNDTFNIWCEIFDDLDPRDTIILTYGGAFYLTIPGCISGFVKISNKKISYCTVRKENRNRYAIPIMFSCNGVDEIDQSPDPLRTTHRIGYNSVNNIVNCSWGICYLEEDGKFG